MTNFALHTHAVNLLDFHQISVQNIQDLLRLLYFKWTAVINLPSLEVCDTKQGLTDFGTVYPECTPGLKGIDIGIYRYIVIYIYRYDIEVSRKLLNLSNRKWRGRGVFSNFQRPYNRILPNWFKLNFCEKRALAVQSTVFSTFDTVFREKVFKVFFIFINSKAGELKERTQSRTKILLLVSFWLLIRSENLYKPRPKI